MPEDALITANVSGGTVAVAGAQDVRIGSQTFISNFYNATPQAEIAKPTGPIPPCPYPGLAYFGPQDAARFFGREQAIQALAAAVARRSFTALAGASGSGKSSVVLAGVAPRLDVQGGWRSSYFRIGTEPDKNPFAAVARALEPLTGERSLADQLEEVQKLAGKLVEGSINLPNLIAACRAKNPGKRILLIADQFEEVFTLVSDGALRNRFIDALIAAFRDPGQNVTPEVCLVLTLRADFYNAALGYRPLADRLQDHVENLGPMNRDELREAIVKPAERVNVGFEPGLVDAILDDVEKRPGSLPLLQFALREMWGRLKAPLMIRADYDAIGGVEGALAKRAQAIFENATRNEMDTASVALFRRLFTRLVTLGDGAEDTRRIVGREELGPDAWALAQKLADEDNRLVVTSAATSGQQTVEVVHEALIRNWPTLIEWVNLDRAFQTWLRQLKPRIDDWRANPSDAGTLLRGGPLVVGEKWIAQRGDEVNDEETAFVAASIELRKAEQQREKEDREREQDRLRTIASKQANAALLLLRRRLFLYFVVIWCGYVGIKWIIFLLSGNIVPGVRNQDLEKLLIIFQIQAFTIASSTLFAVLPRYLSLHTNYMAFNSLFAHIIFVFVSFITSFYLNNIIYAMYPLLHLATNPFMSSAILSITPAILTASLAMLTNMNITERQVNGAVIRALDGLIIAIVSMFGQVAQIALIKSSISILLGAGVIFPPTIFLIGGFGFAVGAYFPVSAAVVLIRAQTLRAQ